MKKLIIIQIACVIAIAYLFFTNQSNTTGVVEKSNAKGNTSTPKTALALGNVKYINTDTLWAKYLKVNDMLDELAGEKIQKEGLYAQQIKQFEKEVLAFQELAPTMTPAQGQQKEIELQQKQQSILLLEQKYQQELLQSEQNKNQLIQLAINQFLKEFSVENNYKFVFGYSTMSNLLYAPDSLNVTDEVVAQLNNIYLQEKEKSK